MLCHVHPRLSKPKLKLEIINELTSFITSSPFYSHRHQTFPTAPQLSSFLTSRENHNVHQILKNTSTSPLIHLKLLTVQAIRGAIAALRPSATSTTLLPHISQSLIQTRLLSSEVRTAIDKAVASAPVVLFMKGTPETPQCGFSRTSIQILGLQGLDPQKFTAFNVLEDEDLRSGKS